MNPPVHAADRPASRRKILFHLGFATALILIAFWLDDPVDRALDLSAHPAERHFAWLCSKAGEWLSILLVGVPGAFLAIRCRRLALGRHLLFITFASGITGLAATVIRSLTGRTRPNNHEVAQGFYGIWHQGHWILGRPEFSSFPSGHSATVAGLAAATWLIDRRWGVLAWAYALLVIWSRIAQTCHHFSDVVAATLLAVYGAGLLHRWLTPLLTVWTESLRR